MKSLVLTLCELGGHCRSLTAVLEWSFGKLGMGVSAIRESGTLGEEVRLARWALGLMVLRIDQDGLVRWLSG